MSAIIRPFHENDWDAVCEIYGQGILTKNATFETSVPDFQTWDKKYHPRLRWVAVEGSEIAGWAALLPVSTRKVYEGVTEVSVYVHENHQGKGIGKILMTHLIRESEDAGIWTLYASIFRENAASIHLHLSHGFREIGYRERIGQLDGVWRDTVLFERRSKKTGLP
jgi:L-amino acid N-acyltransferase YncA